MDDFQDVIQMDWYGQTTLHPVALLMTIVLGAAVMGLPRAWSVVPFLILACFVSPAQRIVVASLDFNLVRILVLVAWARVAFRGEYRAMRWGRTDTLVILYAISGTIIFTIQQADVSALIYRVGSMYDVVGMYFAFRWLIRDWEDVHRIVLAICVIAVPVAALFLVEKSTQRNMFAVFGGVAEFTWIRNGRLRCQGAFAHAILAGCFWAALLPLMAAQLWRGGLSRLLGAIGLLSGLVVIMCCSSSTPVSGVILAVLGGGMFLLRRRMGWFCIGMVILLVFLHMVMKQPVWHLIARIDFVGGSTGWHRFHLMDQAINRFGEWAVLGTPSTAHWGHGLFDVTNQYILEGIRGGFLTMALFMGVIWVSYRNVGVLWRRAEPSLPGQIAAWSLGVGLFVHTTSFVAVSYFGLQVDMVWYLNLAMIASLASLPHTRVVPAKSARPSPARPSGMQARPIPG
jgi:hypothetical protein